MAYDVGGNGDFPPIGGTPGNLVFPRSTGTVIKWGFVLIGVIAFLVALNILRGIYTDWLWFDHLGFLSAFKTVLWTRVWLFATGALLFGLLLTVNIIIARRFSQGETLLPLPAETLYRVPPQPGQVRRPRRAT